MQSLFQQTFTHDHRLFFPSNSSQPFWTTMHPNMVLQLGCVSRNLQDLSIAYCRVISVIWSEQNGPNLVRLDSFTSLNSDSSNTSFTFAQQGLLASPINFGSIKQLVSCKFESTLFQKENTNKFEGSSETRGWNCLTTFAVATTLPTVRTSFAVW